MIIDLTALTVNVLISGLPQEFSSNISIKNAGFVGIANAPDLDGNVLFNLTFTNSTYGKSFTIQCTNSTTSFQANLDTVFVTVSSIESISGSSTIMVNLPGIPNIQPINPSSFQVSGNPNMSVEGIQNTTNIVVLINSIEVNYNSPFSLTFTSPQTFQVLTIQNIYIYWQYMKFQLSTTVLNTIIVTMKKLLNLSSSMIELGSG